MIALLLACGREDLGRDGLGHEYTEPTPILDENAHVQARGWARTPLFGFDRATVPEALTERIREWDFYALYAPDFSADVTLAEIRLGETDAILASVSVHDYATGENLGPQWLGLDSDDHLQFNPEPNGSYDVSFGSDRLTYGIQGHTRVVDFTGDDADGHLVIGLPPGDSVALVTPFDEESEFFYEDKALPLAISGAIRLGDRHYDLPDAAFGVQDWVRGVMPATLDWTWATGVGIVDLHAVGVNLGSVFGDEAGGTPNGIVVDGALHKFGRVEWTFDEDHPEEPWTFADEDGRVDLKLVVDRGFVQRTDVTLGTYSAQLVKAYGHYEGTVVLDDGTELVVDGLLGGAEVEHTRW